MKRIELRNVFRNFHVLQGLWPALTIGAAFVHNLYVSWLKWGDPVVDSGREMMMPLRIIQGEVLYRDHRNAYGPLAPYLNALLYKVFGVHLGVLQAAGIISAAIMVVLIFFLSRRFLRRFPSVVIAVTFLYTFGFAHLTPNPSFNFVVPYAYAATYGMIAATLGLLFIVCHTQEGKDRYLALSIVGLVLAALSKLETLLPIAGAHAAYLTTLLIMGRLTFRKILLYAAGALTIAIPYALITANVGNRLWTDNLAVLMNSSIQSYAAGTMGFDNPARSLHLLGISIAVLAVVIGIGFGTSLLLRRDQSLPIRFAAVALPAVSGFVTYATLGIELPFRLLPALTAVLLFVLIWSFWSKPGRRISIIADLLLWVFAAGCLTRLGLRSVPFHYGFYLLPVPFVALGVLLFRDLPKLLGPTDWAKYVIKATGFGVVVGIIIGTFGISKTFYAEHTMDVNTPRGHIILRGEPWQKEVISYLQKFEPETRIEIIPQGAGLLFLSGVRMAGGLYLYAPMEFFGNYTDQEVVQRLQSWPPDLVIFLTQDPGSFRYTGFGIVFGWQTAKWLRMNYVPVAGNREVIILRYVGANNVSHPLPGAP